MDLLDSGRNSVRESSVEPALPEQTRNSLPPSSLPNDSQSAATPTHTVFPPSSPFEPQEIINNVPGFKYKYPEAAPTPPGVDDVGWNRLYTAADSRMYNKHGKDANSSRKYRASGETRALALVMMKEKREKEALGIPARGSGSRSKNPHAPAPREFPISSRDGTPSSDMMAMSISEKIKAEGRSRKTSVGPAPYAPSSTGGTPQPSSAKDFVKRGTAKPSSKPMQKKRKLGHTPSSSARQTPDIAAPDVNSDYDSDTSTRSGTLYCICKKPDDHSLMIECAGCRNWFHPPCVKLPLEDVENGLVDRYVCTECTTPELMTNFKRMCRRNNVDKRHGKCRRAARVNDKDADGKPQTPSKYCSDECKEVFWRYVASLLRKDERPSVGGAVSRYEVAHLLEVAPNAAAFHRLGQQPRILTTEGINSAEPQPVGLKFLSTHERASVEALKQNIKVKEQLIADYQNQYTLLKFVNERAKRATTYLGRDIKNLICGYDPRLSFNIDEFNIWFQSEEAQVAYSTNTLNHLTPPTLRLIPFLSQQPKAKTLDDADDFSDLCHVPKRSKCKHQYWRELHNQEFGELIGKCKSEIRAMEREIVEKVERAETREATKGFYKDNQTRIWDRTVDGVTVG